MPTDESAHPMIMFKEFSKPLAWALRLRQTEYLQQADAQVATTGHSPPEPTIYCEGLSFVVAEVLLNVRMALRALRFDEAYDGILEKALALAKEKWAQHDAPTGRPGKEQPS